MSEPQSQEEAIAGYLDRLVEFLDWCARYRRDTREPEVFLWNARRALETICLLVEECATDEGGPRGSKRRKKRSDDNGGESLYGTLQRLRSRGLLQDAYPALDSIRQNSNLGVHVQGPGRPEYRTATPTCSHSLFEAVRWVIEFAPFASRLPRAQVAALRAALQDLVQDQVPTPSEQLQEARERAESAEKTVHQLRARASERPPQVESPRASQSGRAWAAVGAIVLATAAFAAGYAMRDADEDGSELVSGTSCDGADAAPIAASDDAARRGGETSEEDVTGLAPRVTSAYVDGESGVEDGRLAEVEPEVAADSAPRWECPDGMRLMEGGVMRIGQPEGGRGAWPRPRPANIAEVSVPRFCIDERAVTTRQLPSGTTRTRHCRWRGKPAAVCVDIDVAERVCERRDARLPKIIEWEWVARHGGGAIGNGARSEWVQNLYPPAVFNRRYGCRPGRCLGRMLRMSLLSQTRRNAAGHVLYSWNRRDEGQPGLGDLGFRCAAEPHQVVAAGR